MKCYRLYKQPAEELYLFARTYHAKLYECDEYAMYLIADGSNPNNSPFIAIEHADDVRGYECEVYKYDGLISYDIIDNNVCYIHNLEEIRMYSEKCLRNVNSLVRANIVAEGYAKTLQDEELTEGVTYLHQRDTGLPCDIIVDCGKTYEYYNHPLCLYVVNGNNVYPVDIVKDTTSSLEIPSEIIMFIKDNYDSLCAFANMEIDGPEFFDIIESYKNNHTYHYSASYVTEMSNYGPDKTG
jgi:hypothetical protein